MKPEITFKILNKTWKLMIVNDESLTDADTGEYAGGQALFPQREITIDVSLEDSQIEHFLKHELTHAFLFECGYQQLILRDVYFTAEFFCEFVSIHAEDILEIANELFPLIKIVKKV